jgi:dTDP-4-dehydrorhamnose 3,5-epimerase
LKIQPLRLQGTYLINLDPQQDNRGYFMRVFDEAVFRSQGLVTTWVQENESKSTHKGTIRGIHFQKPPYSETKLVRVVAGAILDVFVDLRRESETFGHWDSIELSNDNHNLVFIPKGFAHGFCTLIEETVVLYKVDVFYAPQSEGGIRWNDETLNINWPVKEPYLSTKDKSLPLFRDLISPL